MLQPRPLLTLPVSCIPNTQDIASRNPRKAPTRPVPAGQVCGVRRKMLHLVLLAQLQAVRACRCICKKAHWAARENRSTPLQRQH